MARAGTLFGKPREEVVKRPGAFSAKAKAAGKSTGAYAQQVLKEGSQASTRTKRQAALAQTFKKLRAGKTKFLVPLVLAATLGPAAAANKTCDGTTLTPTPLTGPGPTPDTILARAVPALLVQVIRTTGAATATLQVSCDDVAWAPVGNGTVIVDATTPSAVMSVVSPTCSYRVNVSQCAPCSVRVLYSCAGAH